MTSSKVGSAPRSAAPNVYVSTGSGHWIQDVGPGGKVITLEDGSLWRVDDADTYMTMIWLVVTNITVLDDGYNHYRLVNTDDGEVVGATYLGS